MATNIMRVKWLMMAHFSRQKAEVLALIFILGTLSIFVSLLWQTNQPIDGTAIDLSDTHQWEIIERYRKERILNAELEARDKKLRRSGDANDDYSPFKRQVGILDDSRLLDPNFNATKHLRDNPHLIARRKKHIGDETKNNTSQQEKHQNVDDFTIKKGKTKEKYIKYYDPNQGKMVVKPVIVEETELEGGPGHCNIYDITPNITDKFDCMSLSIKPNTPICLYPNDMDIHISTYIRQEGIWEPHIVRDYQNILYGDKELGVIDIGANIGQYSLLAAAMGHQVLAIEPYIENIKHLQKAAHEGNLVNNIVLLQNAVSDTHKKWYLKLWANNQGGVSLQMEKPDPDCDMADCRALTVSTIYMDDLLEVITFKKAVMKIDIEGHEHRAFLHSEKFFEKIYVPYIFMEWMKLRQYHGSEITKSEDKTLTQRLVTYLTGLGYHAYSSVTMERLNPAWWVAWTDDIIWKHELYDIT